MSEIQVHSDWKSRSYIAEGESYFYDLTTRTHRSRVTGRDASQDIADAIEDLEIGVRLAEERDASRVRKNDVENHSDGRRLTGAVWAEETVDRTARHLERQIADGDVLVVPLHDIANVDSEI